MRYFFQMNTSVLGGIYALLWLIHCTLLGLSEATFLRPHFEGVRPTAMGNAFTAIGGDQNVLWYNPALLASINEPHANLLNMIMGADSLTTLNNMLQALTGKNSSNLVNPGSTFMRVGVLPTFLIPNFGISIFDNGIGIYNFTNLSSLQAAADVYSANDIGVKLGVAWPVTPYFSLGASAKLIERTGIDLNTSMLQLLGQLQGISLQNFLTQIYNALYTSFGSGYGVGLDVGAAFTVPLREKSNVWTIGFAALDLGQTQFTPLVGKAPSPIHTAYNFGTALTHYFPNNQRVISSIDIDNNFVAPLPFFKQFHFGVEYAVKKILLEELFISGGYSQGYPTFGAGLSITPHTKMFISSYAIELGNTYHSQEMRVFLIQANIGFDPI